MTFTAPVELVARPQWVAWRIEDRIDAKGEVKPTKVPYNARTGKRAASTDPSTWAPFEEAAAYATEHNFGGIGFVVTNDDPYVGVDLDHCRDDDTGAIEEWAAVIAMQLDSYTEISPSGTGLRIFVRGELPPFGKRKGHVEMYQHARFLTVTGNHLEGSPEAIEDRGGELLELHHSVFGAPPEARQNGHVAARLPLALADADVLKKARAASNGEKFWALWNGDWSGSYDSQSEADLALVSYLAFYTGPDEARLDQLFRASGLVRDKWDRPDYRGSTISKALDGRTEFYGNGSLALAPRLNVALADGRVVNPETGEVVAEASVVVKPRLIMTAAELFAETPADDAPLVSGFLLKGLTHWLYSAPGAGKTMLALALGMHVAAGKGFLGHQVEHGTVLLIEVDSPKRVLRDYMMRLDGLYDLDIANAPFYLNYIRSVNTMNEEGTQVIKDMIDTCPETPTLIILDACERLVPSKDFNSAESHALYQFLQECSDRGIASLMIDHTRKSSKDISDDLEMLTGSSAKAQIGDMYMYIKGHIETEATLTWPKVRSEKPPEITMHFDGHEGFTMKSDAPKLTNTQQQIMRVINDPRNQAVTLSEIMAASSADDKQRKTFENAIGDLVKLGYVVRLGQGRTTAYGRASGGVPQDAGIFKL